MKRIVKEQEIILLNKFVWHLFTIILRCSSDTLDLQIYVRITLDSRVIGRDMNILLSHLSIHFIFRSRDGVGRSSFRSVLPLIIIMPPIVTYIYTTVHLYIMDIYVHIILYIYTYIYIPTTSRIRGALPRRYLALWISLRPLLSPVSTQRTCSPCYFGKHLMLIEPLSLFAPCTLLSCE